MLAITTLILGITSLLVGILSSLLLTFESDLPVIAVIAFLVVPVLAITTGHLALRQANRSLGSNGRRERTVISLIFGYTSAAFISASAIVTGPFELSLALALRFRPANCEIELRGEELSTHSDPKTSAEVFRAIGLRLRRLRVPHEFVVSPSGTFVVRLRVEDPPLDPAREQHLRSFFSPGLLTLHLVHPDNDTLAAAAADGRIAIPAGFRNARIGSESFLLRTMPDLEDNVSNARPSLDSSNHPAVNISFGTRGRDILRTISSANVGRRLAIALDDTLITAPTISGPIEGGEAQITGAFTQQEASELAEILRAGVLPHRLRVMSLKYLDAKQRTFTLLGYSCEPRDSLITPEGAAFSFLGYTCRRITGLDGR